MLFDITHHDHVHMNPISDEKVDELIALLDLPQGARVLDIGCGKAEMLIGLANRYLIDGVGVDLSPYFLAEARVRSRDRIPHKAHLTLLEMDGCDYTAEPESFDVTMCIGASWTFGGHKQTLQALSRLTKPGGLVVAGEPYWIKEPPQQYLDDAELEREEFATHYENVKAGEEVGLSPLYTIVCSQDDWDRYEGLKWRASERFARQHPEQFDTNELLRIRRKRDAYLRWGRDCVGWAIYLFVK
jgi:SAM-dependent methyltransferase